MFRRSGLYSNPGRAKKWDAVHSADGRTYGRMTIDKSLQGQHEFYTGWGTNTTFGGSRSAQGPTAEGPTQNQPPRFEFIPHSVFMDGDYRST